MINQEKLHDGSSLKIYYKDQKNPASQKEWEGSEIQNQVERKLFLLKWQTKFNQKIIITPKWEES